MKTVSWIIDEKEERRMNRLKKALKAKTYSHVFRVATSELEEKFFSKNKTYKFNDEIPNAKNNSI